jgi:hypothetical protein
MRLIQVADQRGSAIQDNARQVHAQTIELVDTQMKALDEKTQALDDFVIKGNAHMNIANISTWPCCDPVSTS